MTQVEGDELWACDKLTCHGYRKEKTTTGTSGARFERLHRHPGEHALDDGARSRRG